MMPAHVEEQFVRIADSFTRNGRDSYAPPIPIGGSRGVSYGDSNPRPLLGEAKLFDVRRAS